jgi:hypothetical protein
VGTPEANGITPAAERTISIELGTPPNLLEKLALLLTLRATERHRCRFLSLLADSGFTRCLAMALSLTEISSGIPVADQNVG